MDLPVDLRGAVVEDIVRAVSNAKWTRTSYDPVAQFVRTKRFTSRPSLRRDRVAPRPLPKGTSSQNAHYSNVMVDSRVQTGEYMAIEPGSASESRGSDDDEFGPETPPGPLRLEFSAAHDDSDANYENHRFVRPSNATTAADSHQQTAFATAGAAQSAQDEVRYAPTPSPVRQIAVGRTSPETSDPQAQEIQVQVHSSEGSENLPSPASNGVGGVPPTRSRSKKPAPKRPKPSQGANLPRQRAPPTITNAESSEVALPNKSTSSSRTSLQEPGAEYELPSS